MAKFVRVKKNATAITRFRGQVSEEVGEAIRRVTLDLLSEAVRRAPVEEGTLRGSATAHFGGERIAVSPVTPDAGAAPATPLEGGAGSGVLKGVVTFNTVYAAEQHERTDFAHPKGGEAKYLERPAEENRGQYARAIREAARRATRGD